MTFKRLRHEHKNPPNAGKLKPAGNVKQTLAVELVKASGIEELNDC